MGSSRGVGVVFGAVGGTVRVGAVRTLAVASVAGRWTSQLPPRSWTVTGPDPRGVPEAAAPPGEPGGSTLVALASPSERSRLVESVAPEPRSRSDSPLVALPACAPSPFDRRCVHSRRRTCRSRDVAIGSGFQARHPVPSSWFRTTSTAYSAPWPRVCCTPLPALGFVALPVARVRLPLGSEDPRGRRPSALSRDADTLRRVPLVSSRAASLRSLPSCRCAYPIARRPKPRAPSRPRALR
jgi:hypothetical protein